MRPQAATNLKVDILEARVLPFGGIFLSESVVTITTKGVCCLTHTCPASSPLSNL